MGLLDKLSKLRDQRKVGTEAQALLAKEAEDQYGATAAVEKSPEQIRDAWVSARQRSSKELITLAVKKEVTPVHLAAALEQAKAVFNIGPDKEARLDKRAPSASSVPGVEYYYLEIKNAAGEWESVLEQRFSDPRQATTVRFDERQILAVLENRSAMWLTQYQVDKILGDFIAEESYVPGVKGFPGKYVKRSDVYYTLTPTEDKEGYTFECRSFFAEPSSQSEPLVFSRNYTTQELAKRYEGMLEEAARVREVMQHREEQRQKRLKQREAEAEEDIFITVPAFTEMIEDDAEPIKIVKGQAELTRRATAEQLALGQISLA